MDKIEPARRRRNMQAIRSKGMKPEMLVRRLVHGMGYRYRLHSSKLPGKPDLVFPSRKKVIFVNGCFWHQHDDPNCKIARTPKSRTDYWKPKLTRNRERDQDTLLRLTELGWSCLVLWECETKHPDEIAKRVRAFLDDDSRLSGC